MYHDVSFCIPVSLHDFYLRCQSACSHGHGACVCTQWWGHVMPVQCCMFCPDNIAPSPCPLTQLLAGDISDNISSQPSPGNCRSGVTSRVRHSFISRSTTCAVHSGHTATHCDPAVVAGPGPMFSAAHLHILYLHIVTQPPTTTADSRNPLSTCYFRYCRLVQLHNGRCLLLLLYLTAGWRLLSVQRGLCNNNKRWTLVRSKVSDDGRCGAKWLEILTSAEPFIIQWDSETDSAHRIHHPRSCCNHLTLAMEQLQLRQRWTCSLIRSNAR